MALRLQLSHKSLRMSARRVWGENVWKKEMKQADGITVL
jgi:hypothetical protein